MLFLLFGVLSIATATTSPPIVVYEDYALPYHNWIAIYFQTTQTTQLRKTVWCAAIEDAPTLNTCDHAQQQRQLYPNTQQVLVHQQVEQPNVIYIDPVILGGWLNPLHQQWLIVNTLDIVVSPMEQPTQQLIQYTHFGMPHDQIQTTATEQVTTTTTTEELVTTTTITDVATTAAAVTSVEPRHSWLAFVLIVSIGSGMLVGVVALFKTKIIRLDLTPPLPPSSSPSEEAIEMIEIRS